MVSKSDGNRERGKKIMAAYISPKWNVLRPRWSTLAVVMSTVVAAHSLAGCTPGGSAVPAPAPSIAAPATGQPSANLAATVPSASPSTSDTPPGADDEEHADGPTAPADTADDAAKAFADAWVRRDQPADQWLAGIAPLCEPGFAALLRTVDPNNLPARQVTGDPKAVHEPADRRAEYEVPTNAGTLTVVLVDLQGRWLAADNAFVSSR
jgi:hypothetical protein